MDNPFNLPALRRAALFCLGVAVFHSVIIGAVIGVLFGGIPIWWPGKGAHA